MARRCATTVPRGWCSPAQPGSARRGWRRRRSRSPSGRARWCTGRTGRDHRVVEGRAPVEVGAAATVGGHERRPARGGVGRPGRECDGPGPVGDHPGNPLYLRQLGEGEVEAGRLQRVADRELQARHRAVWASGDHPTVAVELSRRSAPSSFGRAGCDQRVLDVGAGTGNAAIPAAATGATVTAADLTPELLEAGKKVAAERGVELDWVEADAEALRRRAVQRRSDVRAPPSARRRRDGAGVPVRRDDRDDQLDSGGPHRWRVLGDGPLRGG